MVLNAFSRLKEHNRSIAPFMAIVATCVLNNPEARISDCPGLWEALQSLRRGVDEYNSDENFRATDSDFKTLADCLGINNPGQGKNRPDRRADNLARNLRLAMRYTELLNEQGSHHKKEIYEKCGDEFCLAPNTVENIIASLRKPPG